MIRNNEKKARDEVVESETGKETDDRISDFIALHSYESICPFLSRDFPRRPLRLRKWRVPFVRFTKINHLKERTK